MISDNKDITIEQGTKWEQSILIDPDDYTLVGKEAFLYIKNVTGINTVLEFSEESGNISINTTLGEINITILTEETSEIEKTGVYKLELIEDGEVDRVVIGKVIVIPDPISN